MNEITHARTAPNVLYQNEMDKAKICKVSEHLRFSKALKDMIGNHISQI